MDVVLTCKGDFHDEDCDQKISFLRNRLSSLVSSDCSVLKVEPWNSIRVTFSIPSKAAKQLRDLARTNSNLLSELEVLSVQVAGEEVIKLSSDVADSDPQQAAQPNSVLHQDGVQQPMFNPTGMVNGPQGNVNIMQPINPAKRRRKTKDKQLVKSNKTNQSKGMLPNKPPVPHSVSAADLISQGNPQFSITQLPLSVEEIDTEAWDQEMHRQNPEDDIGLMDIQLQSFSSGANVSAGSNQAMINPAFEQQTVSIQKQHTLPSDACNVMHGMHPELQKQQSVPNNFAPNHLPMEQKLFPGQNIGMAANNMNQINQDPAFYNQPMNVQGGNQEISPPQQINNVAGNYPANNLQASSSVQFGNSAPHVQWQQNSQLQSNVFKMQAHNTNNYAIQQQNQNEISPHTLSMPAQANIMMSQGNILTSQPNMVSQNSVKSQGGMMVSQSQGNVMVTQGSFMTSQSNMNASQGNMMTPQGTLSPAVMGHHQFPFSFPSPVKQQGANVVADKLQVMGQNMSMDSPLLVDLLQNEANAGSVGTTNPAQFPNVSSAGPNQKQKRKKPSRKKKPPKSSAASSMTGSVSMQAYPGMYSMQGQFTPQHFATGEMQGPDQMMSQQMKISSHDPKFIDAISRSDVGAQATGFPNDGAITSEVNLHPTSQQMPMLRRHNSFPVPRTASFPHGFDPTKTSPYPHKAHPSMSPQQQMYMSQMSHPGFKASHSPRQLMVQSQQQVPPGNNPGQHLGSNFQHGNPTMSMIQQGARPQRYPVHSLTPPQMQSLGGFPQPMSHPSRMIKTPTPLPTIPQQRPQRSQGAPKLSRLVGRLSNGVMSIMLKPPCATFVDRKPPIPSMSQQRPQSTHARKSPASSFESASPKMIHPNTPSPKLQHFGVPSPMTVSNTGKNGPPQNRPHSRNFAPTNPAQRRPSLDQLSSVSANHMNRGISNNPTPPPPAGTSAGRVATPPSALHFQSNKPAKLQEAAVNELTPQNPQWANASTVAGSNTGQYFWPGQPQVSAPNLPASGNSSGNKEPNPTPQVPAPDRSLRQPGSPPIVPNIAPVASADPVPIPSAAAANKNVKMEEGGPSPELGQTQSIEAQAVTASITPTLTQ